MKKQIMSVAPRVAVLVHSPFEEYKSFMTVTLWRDIFLISLYGTSENIVQTYDLHNNEISILDYGDTWYSLSHIFSRVSLAPAHTAVKMQIYESRSRGRLVKLVLNIWNIANNDPRY